ncbi:NUDIX domain-containing protein [Streptomyces mirabilis]|uniref:NUDIX domain-containing protein n=1 Tax=Streptomyces sp. NPDC005388 TaxID=3156717 RepID=UPI0033BBC85E
MSTARRIRIASCNFELNGNGDYEKWLAMQQRLAGLRPTILCRQETFGYAPTGRGATLFGESKRITKLAGDLGPVEHATALYYDPAVFEQITLWDTEWPVHEGALRELTEETGVHVAAEDLEFCQLVHYRDTDGVRAIGVVFTAQRWQGEPHNAEPHKHQQILWIDPGNPPADCHPYTQQVLANFTAGQLYGPIDLAAIGGAA